MDSSISTGDIITLNGIAVRRRCSDQHVELVALCKAGEKEYSRWRDLASTNEYLEILMSQLSKSVEELLVKGKP